LLHTSKGVAVYGIGILFEVVLVESSKAMASSR
jgi:hypothetical protein